MSEHAENWVNLRNSSLTRSRLEIQFGLLRCQFAQQRALSTRCAQHCVRSQQHNGVGQQRHAPCEPQTVEEHLPQPELVFLIRLGRLNPRANLLQQSLGGLRVERQQSQQGFVRRRRVGELTRTVGALPTDRTEFCRRPGSKPMPIFANLIAAPLQRLALRTRRLLRRARPVSYPNADASRRRRASVPDTTVCLRPPDSPCRPRLDAATTTSADRSSGDWERATRPRKHWLARPN